MLSFDIRTLESQAVVVDEQLPATDSVWEENDPKPVTAVRVTGRLSAAGPDRFYWHGKIEGDIVLECSRCLSEVRAHVSDEAHVIFASSEDEEVDDPDVYRIDPKAYNLDLRPALREEWLLTAPSFAVCRDDCKGLCPQCGADLNAGECECTVASTDPRWNTLKDLKKLDSSSR